MDAQELANYDIDYDFGQLLELSDGTKIYHEIRGPAGAPVILFVNNYFIISPLWRNFTSRLAQRFRVVSYDLRNQGASTRARGELGFDTHVADLRELIDRLGLAPVYLVGTSVSTLITLDCAVAAPEKVRGLVSVGPMFNPFGGRRRKYVVKSWIHAVESGGIRALFDNIYPLIYSDRTIEAGGSATYLTLRERFLAVNSPAQAGKNLRASLTTTDDWRKLTRIACPTLLMAGDQDFYTGGATLAELTRVMPDARYVVVPSVGHLPYFEATEEFERLIAEFVTEVESRPPDAERSGAALAGVAPAEARR
jgi:pimeloyl-ACP methyl ester carboxylesterase